MTQLSDLWLKNDGIARRNRGILHLQCTPFVHGYRRPPVPRALPFQPIALDLRVPP